MNFVFLLSRIEIIFVLGAFLRRKIVFLLLGDGKEGEMWG